ncbi:hypothetical protein BGZ68_003876 [Mortierella alpina]|nr:hypothetical protein BGZ68_003876 [Mortierella alpina]
MWVDQPNNGGNAPARLADAYRFPPPLYRPRPPATVINPGAPSKSTAPAAATSQAPPPSTPTPSPSQPANPVRGNTPLQKVVKEGHPPQQQHRAKRFTPPPAQGSHRLQTPAGPKPPPPVQDVPPVQEHSNAVPPPPLQGQQGKMNRLDEIFQSMAKQTQQFQTIAQIMTESMAEQANRLQSIERAAERSRLELLERITHVENSVVKAKEEQTELYKPLFDKLCDSLAQIEGLLNAAEGKDSRLIFQILDEVRDGLSRKKDSLAAGPDSNVMSKFMDQQEQQFELIQKAISDLKTEQILHQRIVNETILQTKFEQNQKLDTIVKSTDSNRERLRVLKQMLIVQRGALDRLDEGRACQSNNKPIKNEPTWMNLPDVYKELLEANEGDVLIKLKDGKQIKAISYLIKKRSPVFKSMLDAPMQESATGVVDLSAQYSHEAFREFMAFLYYNKLHAGYYLPLLFELLCIADYFEVDAYKTHISDQIIALIQSVPICLVIASETRKHGALARAIYDRGTHSVMLDLSEMYKELLDADEGDILVKLKDGKQIRAISYLVKRRSPVFKSMLDAPMRESATRVVDLSAQYSHEAFREFMGFLYYNKLHTGSYVPLLFEILRIADYFEVDDYRTYISDQIIALIQSVPICLIIASETRKHGILTREIYDRCLGFLAYAVGGCYDIHGEDSKPWCCAGHSKKTMAGCTPSIMVYLSEIYKELFEAGEGDISVKLKAGKQLRVISYSIKKRSPVFKTMLDASMRESTTGVVDLSAHFSYEAFRECMAFVYYNKPHTGSYVPVLFELLCIADYFDIEAYKTHISDRIVKCITDVPLCLVIASEALKHGTVTSSIYVRCLEFLAHAAEPQCYDKRSGDSLAWCCSGHSSKFKGQYEYYLASLFTVNGQVAYIYYLCYSKSKGNGPTSKFKQRCCLHGSGPKPRVDIDQLSDFIRDDFRSAKVGK